MTEKDIHGGSRGRIPSGGYRRMERFEALSEATLRVAESGLPGFGHGDGVTVAMTKPADCNRLPKDYELGLPDAEAAGDGWVLASSVDGATIVRPAPGPCP